METLISLYCVVVGWPSLNGDYSFLLGDGVFPHVVTMVITQQDVDGGLVPLVAFGEHFHAPLVVEFAHGFRHRRLAFLLVGAQEPPPQHVVEHLARVVDEHARRALHVDLFLFFAARRDVVERALVGGREVRVAGGFEELEAAVLNRLVVDGGEVPAVYPHRGVHPQHTAKLLQYVLRIHSETLDCMPIIKTL